MNERGPFDRGGREHRKEIVRFSGALQLPPLRLVPSPENSIPKSARAWSTTAGFSRGFGYRERADQQCGSVAPIVVCVSVIVRLPRRTVSRNVSRKTTLIAVPGDHHCEPLQLVTLVAASDGPQSLEKALRSAVQSGWNDVIHLILATGFQGSRAERPDDLWQAWAGLSSACKPSTGRLLTGAGVRIDYPLDAGLNGERPIWIVAVACKNPASAAVLVKAGADVNTLAGLNGNGDTMVDTALQRRKPLMAEALRGLGGVTSDQRWF